MRITRVEPIPVRVPLKAGMTAKTAHGEHAVSAYVLVRDITAARRAMDAIIKLNPFTKAAVEMALWDLAGKASGLPVYQLLGGKVRDRVRIKLVVWARDVPGSRLMAEQHLRLGVSCVKVKTGLD